MIFTGMMKFHVSCGERKKIVQLEDVTHINLAIRKSFGIKEKFFLQRYLQDISDWVDLDDMSEVENVSTDIIKLKV